MRIRRQLLPADFKLACPNGFHSCGLEGHNSPSEPPSVVKAEKRLVLGAEWHYDDAMERSEDSKTINTAYFERLNLTIRRSLACLQRKPNATCRSTESLTGQLELLRCYYNFIRPHSSLKFGRVTRTPAQQAGLVPGRLTWRKIFTARLLDHPQLSFRSRMRARAVGQLPMGVEGGR